MIPTRQSTAFPTVAKIRKGTPKQKIMKTYDGVQKEIEIMGKDLKNKFRIEFLPGTKTIREAWHAIHEKDYVKYPANFVTPDGYELTYIRAMIPTERVMDGWRWSNVTYNQAGMQVAEADGDHYISKRDPLTMDYLIRDGEPFEKFEVGGAVSYQRNGKTVLLKLKSSAKLDLFLPELGEFVSFELRTSSYYDSLYMQENLNAIQGIANVLNGGIAGGIPLDIYRVEMDSPYQDEKGSHKGKQWFIQIKANSAWASAAISRMNNFAMTGETTTKLLQPPVYPAPSLVGLVPDLSAVEIQDEIEDEEKGIQPESVEGELIYESKVPAPSRAVPNVTISDYEWETFTKLVERAQQAGVQIKEYNREKMTPEYLNKSTIFYQGKLAQLTK